MILGGDAAELGSDDIDIDTTDTSAWAGTDRDYTYEEVSMHLCLTVSLILINHSAFSLLTASRQSI